MNFGLFPFELRILAEFLIFLPVKPRNFSFMRQSQIRQCSDHVKNDHFIVLAHIDDGIVGLGSVTGVVAFEGVKGNGRIFRKETDEDGGCFDPFPCHLFQLIQIHGCQIQIMKNDITAVFVFKGLD